VSNVLNGLLARAAASFERHEEDDALERLLEAWRESRAEPIAGLARWLSDRLTAGLAPLRAAPFSGHLDPRWRLLDPPRMLGSLMENATRAQARVLCQQLRDLCLWPADPRLTPALLAIARMPVVRENKVLHALCDLLMHLGDPHSEKALRELRASLPPELPSLERLDIVIRAVASQEVPELDEETQERCDALKEAFEARAAAEQRTTALREELLARIYANPDDGTARMVLADLLLEVGDPWGELIMLQSSPQPDEARVEQLLLAHRLRWEVPLGAAIERGRTRFEQGFPVAVRVGLPNRAPFPVPGPAWGTVREIDWNWEGSSLQAVWLTNPHLRGVTRLRRVRDDVASQLGLHPLPVRRLELGGDLRRVTPEFFDRLAALPHLTWVELSKPVPDDVGLCASSLLAGKLEGFEASAAGAWKLAVTPGAEVPVLATLVSEQQCGALAAAIRGAVGFSTRGILIRCLRAPGNDGMDALAAAADTYARVDWDTP